MNDLQGPVTRAENAEAENMALREALELYADPGAYFYDRESGPPAPAARDRGERARGALRGVAVKPEIPTISLPKGHEQTERRWLIGVGDECDELWEGPHRHREGVRCLENDEEVVPAERAEEAEAELARLRKGLQDIARWCESEAIEAAGDTAHALESEDTAEANFQDGRRRVYNRCEAKLSALLGDSK